MANDITEANLCNQALVRLGSQPLVVDLNGNGNEERQFNSVYHQTRRKLLQSNNWNFARKRESLAAHAEQPDYASVWQYRFAYPADSLQIQYIEHDSYGSGSGGNLPGNSGRNEGSYSATGFQFDVIRALEYQTETVGTEKTILCHVPAASAVYTFDNDNPKTWGASFVEFFIVSLAVKVGYAISTNTQLLGNLKIEEAQLKSVAAAHTMNESSRPEIQTSNWDRLRRRGGNRRYRSSGSGVQY